MWLLLGGVAFARRGFCSVAVLIKGCFASNTVFFASFFKSHIFLPKKNSWIYFWTFLCANQGSFGFHPNKCLLKWGGVVTCVNCQHFASRYFLRCSVINFAGLGFTTVATCEGESKRGNARARRVWDWLEVGGPPGSVFMAIFNQEHFRFTNFVLFYRFWEKIKQYFTSFIKKAIFCYRYLNLAKLHHRFHSTFWFTFTPSQVPPTFDHRVDFPPTIELTAPMVVNTSPRRAIHNGDTVGGNKCGRQLSLFLWNQGRYFDASVFNACGRGCATSNFQPRVHYVFLPVAQSNRNCTWRRAVCIFVIAHGGVAVVSLITDRGLIVCV